MRNWLINAALRYLRFFAKRAIEKHKPLVIGITGTAGKSSTKNAIYAVLKDYFPTKALYGNSETGIPLGILGIEQRGFGIFDWAMMLLQAPFSLNYLKGTRYLVVEMAIDEPYPPKNMDYLLTIVKPYISILLNVSPLHTMQFEKLLKEKQYERIEKDQQLEFLLTKIAEEKAKIITKSNCAIGIYNSDDERIKKALHHFVNSEYRTKLLTFGKDEKNNVSQNKYEVSISGTKFTYSIHLADRKDTVSILFSRFVLPEIYDEVFSATLLTGLELGLTPYQIKTSLEKNFILPNGRASIFKGIKNSIIIDSSYNASKVATLAFLDLAAILKHHSLKPLVFLFGDMRELGLAAKDAHEEVAIRIAKVVDYLYCVGPLTMEYVLPEVEKHPNRLQDIRWFKTFKHAGEYLKDHLPKDAIVLVKGSQNTIFLEEAMKYILADKKDFRNLCRQEDFWMKKKKL